jgi:hypothetical protein
MEKLGTDQKAVKPGSKLMSVGIVLLILSVGLLIMNLAPVTERYVPGQGYVNAGGTPSAGFWILLLAGLLLAGIGFGRRVLSGK